MICRLALFLIPFLLCLQAAAQSAPEFVREAEGVREYRLDNGLQVLLVADPSKPTVTVNVTYKVGSRMEGPGETGMAHLLEHLLFKTTNLYPVFSVELSKRGMRYNGTTSYDRTNYFESFAADADLLAWALRAEADRMTGAKVLRKDLDTEMTVVRNEMERNENSPAQILAQRTRAAAFQWHAYGRSVIGARSDVENVDIPSLQAFYRKYYQPDNATLIVSGAFDPDKALDEIGKSFGALPKPSRQLSPTYTQEPVQEGEKTVTLQRVGGANYLYAVYHAPALASPDYAAFRAIATALAGSSDSRLYKLLVESGKATSVSASIGREVEPGMFHIGVQLKKDDSLDEVQRLLSATLDGLAHNPVTAEELARTKQNAANGFDRVAADAQSIGEALSEVVAAGDWRLYFNMRNRIQDLTLDQVNAVAKAWLVPSNRTLGRFIATDKPLRAPLGVAVSAADALKDYKPRAALAAGENFDTSPSNIDARTERYTLPSGLRVALLPKKSRGEAVLVQMSLHFGNLQSLKGQRQAAAAVGALLGTGTQQKTRIQLADAFRALQTQWSISGGLQSGYASLSSRREQLSPALALLAEALRQPVFTASELEQCARRQQGGIEALLQEPTAVAARAMAQLNPAPEADPRRYIAPEEEIAAWKQLRLGEVADFYRSHWGADHGELAIVGDFDAAQVKPLIAQLFGDWKSAQRYQKLASWMPSVTGQRVQSNLKDKANAVVMGQFTLAMSDDDPDYAALRLAAHIFSGDRLKNRLRSKEGMSYSASASFGASSTEAMASWAMTAIFAPENRARVEQAMQQELQRFVQNGVTERELATAKQVMQAQAINARAEDGNLAGSWRNFLELDRSFRRFDEQQALRQALTVEQVNAAIKKWVAPDRFNWFWAGDFDKGKSN